MNLVGELLEPRCQILVEYAKWTALSAVKAGGVPDQGQGARLSASRWGRVR